MADIRPPTTISAGGGIGRAIAECRADEISKSHIRLARLLEHDIGVALHPA